MNTLRSRVLTAICKVILIIVGVPGTSNLVQAQELPQTKYPLVLSCSDKDKRLLQELFPNLNYSNQQNYNGKQADAALLSNANNSLQIIFVSRTSCQEFIDTLQQACINYGYLAASLDTIQFEAGHAYINLYIGEQYRWDTLNIRNLALNWQAYLPPAATIKGIVFNTSPIQDLQEKIVKDLARRGYPFAAVSLDSFKLDGGNISATLQIDSGRLYKIDSIRSSGEVKITPNYLEKYLQLPKGSVYNSNKLEQISKRIEEVPFLKEAAPWQLTMLGTGAVVDLYLEPEKSNQIDLLIGFLPGFNAQGERKFLVTGEANIQLKNAFQRGELIGFNWQQLQQQSPRLQLHYNHPYVLRSDFGMDLTFDLFKKDSSYLNLSAAIGVEYFARAAAKGLIYLKTFSTNILEIDTMQVMLNKKLPAQIDLQVLSLGVGFTDNTTDYRYNPRKGAQWELSLEGGKKTIRKNTTITNIIDPHFDYNQLYDTIALNSYQLTAHIKLGYFMPLGKQSTFKLALAGGWLESPAVFSNELFQIGGNKLLRGFDEQSIFAAQYGVATAEFRYLLNRNSYFSAFSDLGVTSNRNLLGGNPGSSGNGNNGTGNSTGSSSSMYLGFGLGMAFETKGGIFNLAVAMGKQDVLAFNPSQTKIHFGYVNYF